VTRVYADRRQQRQLAGSLIVAYLVSMSVVVERDPTSGLVPKPSDYLWVVIPGTVLVAVFVARAWRVRLETTPSQLVIHRVAGRETLPWADISRFEVVPTPSRRGFSVAVRMRDERLLRIRSFVPLRRSGRPRQAAAARSLADALEADAYFMSWPGNSGAECPSSRRAGLDGQLDPLLPG
jgi:hypothetical protein